MIQNVIGRLGNNGFVMKGWALTVAGLFFGFAVNSEKWELAAASVLPTMIFWILDAYFLRCERLFRELFERVRVGDGTIEPFFMSATGQQFVTAAPGHTRGYWTTFWRPTLRYFYGAVLGSAGLTVAIVFLTKRL